MTNNLLNRAAFPTSNVLSNSEVKEVVSLWRQYFPNVTVITTPSENSPFLTLSHGFQDVHYMDVNGLRMKSPLFTMGMASFEIAEGINGSLHYASAYEVMWPNISSPTRESSNMNNYVSNLWKLGCEVHSDHYHWKTDVLNSAVHHMGIDMTPFDFSTRTITALNRLISDTKRFHTSSEEDTPLTTANARGSISTSATNGIIDMNGNGSGAGMSVDKRRRVHFQ